VDGPDSGIYMATPLSRLNASDGMATPLAQAEYEKFYATLKGKPVHQRLAIHWARLVELLYAAEHWVELATDPEITSPNFHTIPTEKPTEGCGHRRGAARHPHPSLLDRRARCGDQGQPGRRHHQ
jgi:F420-non-reducing hydrogenase large subunit